MTNNRKSTPSPDSYRQRDTAILRLTGLHGVCVTESINATIGGGKTLGHIIRRLAESGELTLHSRALDGGVSYFQLSEKSVERLGFPKERSKPLGAQALEKSLVVLVWCTLRKTRGYKIERGLLSDILPGVQFPTNQVHCLSDEDGHRVVWRMQLVQGNGEPVIKALKQEIAAASGELRHAVASLQYGFVFLVDSVVKQKFLEGAVERSGLRDSALVRVDLSATAKTMAAYLRKRTRAK